MLRMGNYACSPATSRWRTPGLLGQGSQRPHSRLTSQRPKRRRMGSRGGGPITSRCIRGVLGRRRPHDPADVVGNGENVEFVHPDGQLVPGPDAGLAPATFGATPRRRSSRLRGMLPLDQYPLWCVSPVARELYAVRGSGPNRMRRIGRGSTRRGSRSWHAACAWRLSGPHHPPLRQVLPRSQRSARRQHPS